MAGNPLHAGTTHITAHSTQHTAHYLPTHGPSSHFIKHCLTFLLTEMPKILQDDNELSNLDILLLCFGPAVLSEAGTLLRHRSLNQLR